MENMENNFQGDSLIDLVNKLLRDSSSPFIVESITLAPTSTEEESSSEIKIEGEKNMESPMANEVNARFLALCDPSSRPDCGDRRAVCIVNHGGRPYWECRK